MVNLYTKFEVSMYSRTIEWRHKMQKMGWFGGIKGHGQCYHWHKTSYLTLIETMRLSFTVFEI